MRERQSTKPFRPYPTLLLVGIDPAWEATCTEALVQMGAIARSVEVSALLEIAAKTRPFAIAYDARAPRGLGQLCEEAAEAVGATALALRERDIRTEKLLRLFRTHLVTASP